MTEGSAAEFMLEDPALFDAALTRIIEDIELSAYMLERYNGGEEIGDGTVIRFWLSLVPGGGNMEPPPPAPLEVVERVRPLVSDLARAPIPYSADAANRVAQFAGAAMFDFLSSGAEEAARDESHVVKTRHFLPACERWPFPFNRFC